MLSCVRPFCVLPFSHLEWCAASPDGHQEAGVDAPEVEAVQTRLAGSYSSAVADVTDTDTATDTDTDTDIAIDTDDADDDRLLQIPFCWHSLDRWKAYLVCTHPHFHWSQKQIF